MRTPVFRKWRILAGGTRIDNARGEAVTPPELNLGDGFRHGIEDVELFRQVMVLAQEQPDTAVGNIPDGAVAEKLVVEAGQFCRPEAGVRWRGCRRRWMAWVSDSVLAVKKENIGTVSVVWF